MKILQEILMIKSFEHHRGDVKSIVVGNSFLYTASSDGSILLYGLKPRVYLKKTLFRYSKPIVSLFLCNGQGEDSNLLVSTLDSKLFLLSNGKETARFELENGEFITGVTQLSGSSGVCFCGSSIGNVITFDTSRNDLKLIGRERCHQEIITSISTCNDLLATCSRDNKLRVWNPNLPLKRAIRILSCSYRSGFVSSLPISSRNTILVSGDYEIRIFKFSDLSTQGLLGSHDGYVSTMISIPNDRVISGSQDHTIKIWNLESKTLERTLVDDNMNSYVNCLACFNKLIFSGSNDGNLNIWELRDQKVKRKKKKKTTPEQENRSAGSRVPFSKVTGNIGRPKSTELFEEQKGRKRKRGVFGEKVLEIEKDRPTKVRKLE